MGVRELGNPLGNPLGLPRSKGDAPAPIIQSQLGAVRRSNFLPDKWVRLSGQVLASTDALRAVLGDNSATGTLAQYPSASQLNNNNVMYCGSFSPDGKYFAAGGSGGTTATTAYVYSITDTTTFTALPAPDVAIPSFARGITLSPNGEYMAIAHQLGDRISIYRRDGNQFVKLPSPSALPPGIAYSCEFSPDGLLLAVGGDTAPYLTIYRRDGDVFTKIAGPSVLPTATVHGVSFSLDGKYFAASYGASPFLSAYRVESETFTALSTPTAGTISTQNYCDLSKDGSYLAHISGSTLRIYKRDGDAFALAAATGVGTSSLNVSIRSDAESVAYSTSTTGFMKVLEFNGSSFTDAPAPSPAPSYATSGVLFSPDNKLIMTISKESGASTKMRFYGTPGLVLPNLPGHIMRVEE